ncbi:MAG: hypothetical protein ACK5NF_07590 [Bacilli bacterium]
MKKVYLVSTSNKSSSRYSEATREAVVSWAASKEKRPYDFDFANNKQFTAAEDLKYNCSELVWKAWKTKAGVDLDSNGGSGVYPNNIKDSSRTKFVKNG